MRALLERDELPIKLDELRTPLLEVVEELGAEIASSSLDSPASAIQERLLTDGSQTLAIMGQRGSGKSTLLAAVSAELVRDGRHLVVPIMRPDLFSETDSVITTFLAELWELLALEAQTAVSDQEPAPSPYAEAIKLLGDTARGFAVSRTTTAALEHGTDSPSDFADDFLTVSRSGVRLVRQLRALANELCFRTGEAGEPRLIVVPIDDPDLTRQSIIDILTDLQILGSVPGIVPLTCFSPDDLNGAWVAARRNLLPEASEKHLRFLLARQLEKVFPYRCRFEIEPIAPIHRADFAPIGRKAPMREQLTALRTQIERISGGSWAIDEALTIGQQQFGLPNPLPDNARTLVQLWETLDAVRPESGETAPEAVHLALRRVLNLMVERVAVRLGSSRLVQIGPPLEEAPAKRSMEIGFSGVQFFVTAKSKVEEPSAPSMAFFHLRSIARARAATPAGDPARRTEYKPEDYLTGDETSALLVLQEIAFGSGLFEVEGPRVFIGEDEWRFLQKVELANQPTDDMFLLLPDATTLSEVLRSAALWNRFAELSTDMTTEAVLSTCIEAACLTVEHDAELEPRIDYEQAFERACDLYTTCLERGGNTAQAFVEWFEQDLPLQWHSALLSGERIRKFAGKHQELREKRTMSSVTRTGTDLFERRLGMLLDALAAPEVEEEAARYTWVAGYFELASSLGSDHLDRIGKLYPRWQRDSAEVRAGAATVGTLTQVGSRMRMAPFATPESTELLAAGVAALRLARRTARAEMRSSG